MACSQLTFVPVDGGWSENGFAPCISNGTCGEFTTSKTESCNNPKPSINGRKCSCNDPLSSILYPEYDCDGDTEITTKYCNPESCKQLFHETKLTIFASKYQNILANSLF